MVVVFSIFIHAVFADATSREKKKKREIEGSIMLTLLHMCAKLSSAQVNDMNSPAPQIVVRMARLRLK